MNRKMIACVLALMVLGGGILYGENSDAASTETTTVAKARRGQAKHSKRVRQISGMDSAQRKGRQQAIANLKAMDKNGDGNISKSEATGKIARHFDKIDANGNGTLSEAELKSMKHNKRKNSGDNSQERSSKKGRRAKQLSTDKQD